jgi:GDP-4-dehydro-6-deoxy-D-mannose reductase
MALNGLRVIRFRPFNHTGPGQTDQFVVPAFASQIARIEAGLQSPVLRVGNLDAQRDFLDVRDVVDAYVLAVEKSDDLPTGTILNIASGRPRRIRELLDHLLSLSRRDITVEADPARQRPNDTPVFAGDASRARRMLGWAPRRDIQDTLLEILNACRRQSSSS